MAGKTTRFGLNMFDGANQPGALSDDGNKFTGADREFIDLVLAALERHDHAAPSATLGGPDAPLLSTDPSGGSLSSGQTLYYRTAFFDATGLETPASSEVSIALPDLLPTPDAPAGEVTTGGTLAAGLYYYAVTGIRGSEESPIGDPVPVTVGTSYGTVVLTLPALGDATAYRVWRLSDADGLWRQFSGTVSSGSFTDNGSATPTPTDPPYATIGAATHSVTVTLDTTDATAVQSSSGWRIYRTVTSGTYPANSLVHQVVDRVDDTDLTSPLLTEWVDDGDALTAGSPLGVSGQLAISPLRVPILTTLPATTGYVTGAPIIVDGVLYALIGGTWTALGGGGGGGGAEAPTWSIMPAPTAVSGDTFTTYDGGFSVTFPSAGTWRVEATLYLSADADSSLQVAWTNTGTTMTCPQRRATGPDWSDPATPIGTSRGTLSGLATPIAYAVGVSGEIGAAQEEMLLLTVGAGDSISLSITPGVVTGSTITVHAGLIRAERISA